MRITLILFSRYWARFMMTRLKTIYIKIMRNSWDISWLNTKRFKTPHVLFPKKEKRLKLSWRKTLKLLSRLNLWFKMSSLLRLTTWFRCIEEYVMRLELNLLPHLSQFHQQSNYWTLSLKELKQRITLTKLHLRLSKTSLLLNWVKRWKISDMNFH